MIYVSTLMDKISKISKPKNKKKHSSFALTPGLAFSKKIEGYILQSSSDKRKKKTKVKIRKFL